MAPSRNCWRSLGLVGQIRDAKGDLPCWGCQSGAQREETAKSARVRDQEQGFRMSCLEHKIS